MKLMLRAKITHFDDRNGSGYAVPIDVPENAIGVLDQYRFTLAPETLAYGDVVLIEAEPFETHVEVTALVQG